MSPGEFQFPISILSREKSIFFADTRIATRLDCGVHLQTAIAARSNPARSHGLEANPEPFLHALGTVRPLTIESSNFTLFSLISRKRCRLDDITTPGLRWTVGGKGTLPVRLSTMSRTAIWPWRCGCW